MTDREEHFRRLERAYHGAPCNQAIAPVLKVSEGASELRFTTSPDMHHAGGAVHGTYYFKALDDAAYFAANSLVEDALVLTASFSLELLRPVVSGELLATGRVRKPGRSLIFAEAVLVGADGKELAIGRGTFARSQLPVPV